ncbi:MAG TPA: pyridoxamine 5'-phosphate oxidase [Balneolaceae bacterium]|nr:pyridoxamine 5'-phosphate oxidase [Balneolaceae bacterium]
MTKKKDVSTLRRDYSGRSLTKKDVAENPVEQFARWFRQALAADLTDANAMTLATATKQGVPSARIVLLKGFDESGFKFYTNYNSRKGRELEQNPSASLCFYWPELDRQVRIEGKARKLSTEKSASYFQQRPRLSQASAWASFQSSEIESRETLEKKFKEIKKRFKDQEIPLPDFWGGYLLQPSRIEFWQGRPNRLHDRIVYSKINNTDWEIKRLAP